MKEKKVFWNLVALAVAWGAPLGIQAGQPGAISESEPKRSALESWWNGKYASGNWFGVRDTLEDHGLKLGVEWKANFLWNVDGGLEQRFGYDDEWKFRGTLDFAKATGWEAIEGLTAYSDLRYRGGAGVNKWVGASNQFSSEHLPRRQVVAFSASVSDLYDARALWDKGVSDPFRRVAESNGYFHQSAAEQIFHQQYLHLGSRDPRQWLRLGRQLFGMGRLYQGKALRLVLPPERLIYGNSRRYRDVQPRSILCWSSAEHNGLYWLIETGFTPKIGPSKLPGRYAAGFIYWGVENTSFFGRNTISRLLFYWQADQQLYREPSPEAPPSAITGPSDGKSVATEESPRKGKALQAETQRAGTVFLQPDRLRAKV